MAKGTAPTCFFYIISGSCMVTVDGKEVNRIESGQFLGEIGVMYESTRIADVRAVGETEVLVLNSEDLSLALDMFPGLYHELGEVAKRRLEHMQARVNGSAGSGASEGAEPGQAGMEYSSDGVLQQFLNFLKNVASESRETGAALHPSHPRLLLKGRGE
jgi:CRP-like cAMP-binding protein